MPAKPYELTEWKKVTVNIDYRVEYSDSSGRHYYSVPYTLVHQKLELRATASTIEAYKGGGGWGATFASTGAAGT